MIYRVEFRKDGAVASCVEVESQHRDGGLVCYVEAGDRPSAIEAAKKRWQGIRGRIAARLGADPNICRECLKRPRSGRGKRCDICRAADARTKREREALRELPENEARAAITARKHRISEERTAHLKRLAIQNGPRAREALMRKADARWDSAATIGSGERSTLRQVLRAYDRDPAGFRIWLLKMLGQEAQAAE